jgi:hypothetical protein
MYDTFRQFRRNLLLYIQYTVPGYEKKKFIHRQPPETIILETLKGLSREIEFKFFPFDLRLSRRL